MKLTTKKMVLIASFAAISVVLMFFETSLPIFPSFLKIDISTVIVLLSGYIISPVSAIIVALIKDFLHLPLSQTEGIGELADFLVSAPFVFTATIISKKLIMKKKVYATIIGLIVGIAVSGVVAIAVNYWPILPLYSKTMMPIEAIVKMAAEINPHIVDKLTLLIYVYLPFNLLKFSLVSVLAFFIYLKVIKIPLFHLNKTLK
ncbi:MAG: ECF transporter S component [Bacillota bacterium]|nr:ECF transporter S component [Bacillota bacterium]